MSAVLKSLGDSVQVDDIYMNEYAGTLFEALMAHMNIVRDGNEYVTKSMTWFGYARNLIREVGYEGESVMNATTWQYAIAEGLKGAGIEIVPGVYRKRPSYSRLYRIRLKPMRMLTQTKDMSETQRKALSMDFLSFTLPLKSIPKKFDEWYQTFLSRNAEIGRSSENANKFRQRQNLVRRLIQSLDVNRCYDNLLLIYTNLLSIRKPLPYTTAGSRQKEWSNLKAGIQSVDYYATGVICVGLYYKYRELQHFEPDEMDWTEFRRRLGTSSY
jgi:hypothetical protein